MRKDDNIKMGKNDYAGNDDTRGGGVTMTGEDTAVYMVGEPGSCGGGYLVLRSTRGERRSGPTRRNPTISETWVPEDRES